MASFALSFRRTDPPDPNNIRQLSGGNPNGWNFDLQSTQVMQWSAGVQRELVSNMLVDVAYVGSRTNTLISKFAERYRLQFRTEMYNAFNRANFGVANAAIGNPLAGQISSTAEARTMQLALKMYP